MYFSSTSPVLLEQLILNYLVVEAFDGTEIGADDGELGGSVGR